MAAPVVYNIVTDFHMLLWNSVLDKSSYDSVIWDWNAV